MSCDVGLVSWGGNGTWAIPYDYLPNNQELARQFEQLHVIRHNYNPVMTNTHSTPSRMTTALDAQSDDDRVWLTERLVEHRELLAYLYANCSSLVVK